MLKSSLVLACAGILTAYSVFAAGNATPVEPYLEIQNLLAHDTFEGVTAAAKRLEAQAKAAKQTALSKQAGTLATAQDIKTARLQFEKVSVAFLPFVKKSKPVDVEIVYCPMKKASWAQKKGPIENPYYGKEMLECGVKEE